MIKPMPLFPGPRPPYLEDLVKKLKDRLAEHESDTEDPHQTRKQLPLVYSGDSLPQLPSDTYKATDLFVCKTDGYVYAYVVENNVPKWNKVDITAKKELLGRQIGLENDNDLYAAVQLILETLGATVR